MKDTQKFKIIIVEDDLYIRQNIEDYLSDEGFLTSSFERAELALEALKLQVFDCAIVDMRLPRMNGSEFIMKAHHIQNALQFIIHTGSSDFLLPQELRDIGIQETQILIKPLVDMKLITDLIRDLCL